MNREGLAVVYAIVSGLVAAGVVVLFGFAGAYALWLLSALLPVPAYLFVRKHRVGLALAPNLVMGCAVPPFEWFWFASGLPLHAEELAWFWGGILGTAMGIGAAVVLLLAGAQWLRGVGVPRQSSQQAEQTNNS